MGAEPEADCLHRMLGSQAGRAPGAAAIAAPGRIPLTYAGLLEHVERVVADLGARGLGRGDRVAIVLPNGPEMAVAFLAVAAGAASAPLNPAFRAAEFGFCLSDLGARALVVQAGVETPAREAARERGIPILELAPLADGPAGLFTLGGESPPPAATAGFADPADVALVLHTSGTTSRPKIVPLTQANLVASARHIALTLELREGDRCLNVMPLFHIHGLVAAVLASLAAGASVACTPGFRPDGFFPWMEEVRPTWYTAVPTMHQAVLARAEANRPTIARCPLRFVRSSSAALPPQVMAGLEAAFGAPVIEAYGMTEASHQIASNPLPPRERRPGSVGLAAGPEVAVADEAGRLLPPGEVGEVVIRGPSVTRGYENNPAANQGAFLDGWLRTGDLGTLDAEGYLTLTGRLKEMINRGGEKVAPREVDEVLLAHPAVAQAVAFAVPHATLGEDVAAAVVLRDGAAATEQELRDFARARLADHKVPSQVLLVPQIPKGPTGKLQRIGLAEKLAPFLRAEYAAPRSPVERALADIWAAVLGSGRVGIHDNFFALGGDSLSATRVVARVRESLGAGLPLRSLFDAPTVAGLAALIPPAAGGTRPAEFASPAFPRPSGPRPPASRLPLSFAQQRLWFLHQLEPDSIAYNVPFALRLRGPLSVPALERALNGTLRRHEALRTSFPSADGEPVQAVAPHVDLVLTPVAVEGASAAEREDAALRLAVREARWHFDLGRGPLLRATLLRLATDDHVLLLATHHIVADGWSRRLLFRELAALYGAFAAGQSSPLPELPIQYADFAAWHRRWLEDGVLEEQLDYWRRQLAGVPTLELPTDRRRPAIQTYPGATETLLLPPALGEALAALGRREGATPFMTLLAAFDVLLARWSGQDDVAIGSPVAGRDRVELEGLVGLFVNTLVLRTDLSGDPTFRELLARVRETALDAYAHQDMPFEKLVGELRLERDVSRTPLFQVMFQLRGRDRQEFPRLDAEVLDLDIGASKFDLCLDVAERPSGLRCAVEYNTDLFDRDTIRRMLGHFRTLLEGIAADPGRRISELPLLTEAERHQILVEWNDTEADYPRDRCVHDLFEEQAERRPEAVAVLCADGRLTYGELNARANRLAHHLRGLGVGPDVPVALCMARSPDMMVAMLGILKAGGAYVPLDVEHPQDRVSFVLGDSGAGVVVTQRGLLDRFAGYPGHIVAIDRDRSLLAAEPQANPPRLATPDHLIYIMYTSGSTGKPKGALIEHRGVVSYIAFLCHAYGLGSSDVTLQVPSVGWDASVADLLMPLVAGGTVALVTEWEAKDPEALLRRIDDHGVTTIVTLVPSLLRLMAAAASENGRRCESLRVIVSGGEALRQDDVRRARAAFGGRVLIANEYGPTETTCTHTYYPVAGPQPEEGIVPIGRPVWNKQAYILDRCLNPVPVGVAGELYLGGVGLARGYLGRPELTAAAFVPNPFRNAPGGRLYRSGDLARYRRDGTIEFLGRADDQVKILGARVEPGEVEAALALHPAVGAAAVKAAAVAGAAAAPGEKALVAYVVPRQAPPSVTALRAFLKERLPDYMVPSAFVFLDRLPLLPSGKLDRRALPAPDWQGDPDGRPRPRLDVAFVAPRTPVEERLAGMWVEVLGLERVGVCDDFFELGGHSLKATALLARVRRVFGVRISFPDFFAAPTVEGIAIAVLSRLEA